MNLKNLFGLLVAATLVEPLQASAAGIAPWEFGMSPAQVQSFKEYAPYKRFSNGDLETFRGLYQGRKENVQFFFVKSRLKRIGIYLYEGKDRNKAIAACRRAYEALRKTYGTLTIPDQINERESRTQPVDVSAFAAVMHADVIGRTRFRPVKQPKNMFAQGEVFAVQSREGKSFAVAIFFDAR